MKLVKAMSEILENPIMERLVMNLRRFAFKVSINNSIQLIVSSLRLTGKWEKSCFCLHSGKNAGIIRPACVLGICI